MYDLLISSAGIAVGIFLAKINPEELPQSLHYARWVKLLLLLIFLAVAVSNALANTLVVTIIILTGLVLGIIIYKNTHLKFELLSYTLFIYSYLNVAREIQLILSSLIFLYGIPVGLQWFGKKI